MGICVKQETVWGESEATADWRVTAHCVGSASFSPVMAGMAARQYLDQVGGHKQISSHFLNNSVDGNILL